MTDTYKKLKEVAKLARRHILTMSYAANSAHSGGSLSCVEILVMLYFQKMQVYPKNASNPKRDRLIFSKAHDAKALYAVLALRGFFSVDTLKTYETNNGILPGHSTRNVVPGIEVSAGSLGHGLSMAAGVAFAGKIDNKKFRVYAILSDGECNEGSTWEAILFASHHKLSNLTVIVDYNKLQGYGYTKDVLELEPFVQKWEAFGWATQRIDGHSFSELDIALKRVPKTKPMVIIANTIKGYGGVKKYINTIDSQYKSPTLTEYEIAIKDLKS